MRILIPMLVLAVAALAQTPAAISVSGRVTDSAGSPLRNATVTLARQTQSTDEEGRFKFESVAPGNYRLNAERNGYLPRAYGATAPDATTGTPLVLKDGDKLENLIIALFKQAVIAGRVTDGSDALQGVEVRVARLAYVNGQRQLQSLAAGDTTDDLGGFRVTGLPPGRYYVYATVQPTGLGPMLGDQAGPTAPTALFPTYFPNAVSAAAASVVEIAAGGEGRADIRMRRDRVHTIRGTVMSRITGRPSPGALVGLLVDEDPPAASPATDARASLLSRSAGPFTASAKANEEGKFELRRVPAGPHTLAIFGGDRISIKTGANSTMGTQGSPAGAADNGSIGFAQVNMPDADLDNMIVTVSAPGQITGTLRVETGLESLSQDLRSRIPGGANIPADAIARLARLPVVRLSPVAKVSVGNNSGTNRNEETRPDGSFSLGSVAPGRYYVALDGFLTGYYIQSIRLDNTDITRVPLDFNGGTGELTITLAKGGGDIAGTAAAGVIVSLWPKTPDFSTATGGIKSVVADQTGAFKFTNIAPGEYYAAGFAQLPETGLELFAPFLAALNEDASSVKLEPTGGASAAAVPVIPAEKAAAAAGKLP